MMRNGSMRALSGSLLNTIIAGAAIAASGGLAACRGAAPGQRAIAGEPSWTATARAGAAAPGGDAPPAPRSPATFFAQDYVGSKACEPCHSEIYAAWARSPMHQMTRLPDGARIRAPFDGVGVSFQERPGALRERGRRALHSRRVGQRRHAPVSRHQGDWRPLPRGLRGRGGARRRERARSDSPARPSAELILPVSFVFQPPSFRLKGYSVMVGERPGLRAGGVWNQTCIFCHNTNPLFRQHLGRALRSGRARLPGRGRRSLAAAGAARSRSRSPTRRRWRARSTGELAVLGDEPPAAATTRRGGRGAARVAGRDACTPCGAI